MTEPQPKPRITTPRWVKIWGAIIVAFAVAFLAFHLAGNGLGGAH